MAWVPIRWSTPLGRLARAIAAQEVSMAVTPGVRKVPLNPYFSSTDLPALPLKAWAELSRAFVAPSQNEITPQESKAVSASGERALSDKCGQHKCAAWFQAPFTGWLIATPSVAASLTVAVFDWASTDATTHARASALRTSTTRGEIQRNHGNPQALGATGMVTIDAMDCQRQIAEQIPNQDGDYVLGLKGNQSTMQEAVADFFSVAQGGDFSGVSYDSFEEVDKGHGHLEIRRCWITEDLQTLPNTEQWMGLRSKGNAPAIMTAIRHLCMNLFERQPSSLRRSQKRRKTAWNDDYRAKVVFG